jgi:acetyltransferase-like isoleucine patch superfamily enzyme
VTAPPQRHRTFRDLLSRGLRDPRQGIRFVWGVLKGHWYLFNYRLRGGRVRAGRYLQVYGRLVLEGPGTVEFGNSVRVYGVTTIPTYKPDARVIIGDFVGLDSVRFGCALEITIGSYSMVADSRIMDTNFHSLRADRHSEAAPVKVSPVRIEQNVWVAGQAGILPGTVIGENSVVGFGAVCRGLFPRDVVIAGNPARVAAPLPTADDTPSPDAKPGPEASPGT